MYVCSLAGLSISPTKLGRLMLGLITHGMGRMARLYSHQLTHSLRQLIYV
jgi:hypothetical protein